MTRKPALRNHLIRRPAGRPGAPRPLPRPPGLRPALRPPAGLGAARLLRPVTPGSAARPGPRSDPFGGVNDRP